MNSPFVSIVMLVRNSPYFERAIESVLRTSSVKDVEVLVKVDSDEDISPYANVLKRSGLSHKILVYERGEGSNDTHIFWLDLFRLAKGDFIFMFGDDMIMHDNGWVEKLREVLSLFEDQIVVCTFSKVVKRKFKNGVRRNGTKKGTMCPVINRKFFECNKEYISPGRGVDKYIRLIATTVKRYIHIRGIKFSVNQIKVKDKDKDPNVCRGYGFGGEAKCTKLWKFEPEKHIEKIRQKIRESSIN